MSHTVNTTCPNSTVCQYCDHIAVNCKDLDTHLKSVHDLEIPTPEAHVCYLPHTKKVNQKCMKNFKTHAELKRHQLTAQHAGPTKNFVCQFKAGKGKKKCGKRFQCQQTLTQHHHNIHVNPEVTRCSTCTKTFASKAGLRTHEQTINCSSSDMLYASKSKPLKCKKCPKQKAFTKKSEYDRHMLIHLPGDAGKPYKCDSCSKRFSQKSNMTRHMTTCKLCKQKD